MKTPFLCLGLVIILFGTSCADTGKDFSEEFKTGWLSSCQKQAGVNMAQSQAKEYCQCSLDIVMERYEQRRGSRRSHCVHVHESDPANSRFALYSVTLFESLIPFC